MLLILSSLLLIYLVYHFYWKRRNLPPGPTPLPLIGNLHQLIKHQPGYQFTQNCKKAFNPIYTWWMGTKPIVMICDYELMKETFVKDGDSYSNKHDMKGTNQEFRGGDYGIIMSSGERWREHRRFALHQMRDLGLGKMKMSEKILIEVDDLTTKLMENGKVDIQKEFEWAVANIINQLMFGYRFAGEKYREFEELMNILERQQKLGGGLKTFAILFKFCRMLPGLKQHYQKFLQFRHEFFGFFEQQIEQHRNEFNYEIEDSTDYVEAYLKEKKKRESLGDFDSFCDLQLKNVVFDLWSAGLATTTATLNWGIAYLLNHPQVQTKMHEEMDRVIGSSRNITMSDRPNLPYTTAVIMEIQRALNLVVTNLPHETTRDVEVAGYKIPKGTTIIADIGVLLYDEKLFPNPDKFDPERFLENGKIKTAKVMPFSIGKRACPGEGLARMELFLILANICNRFKLIAEHPPPLKKSFKTMQKPTSFIEFKAECRH